MVKCGSENSKNKTNHNLPTMLTLWQYDGIGCETILSKHGRRILVDRENVILMFQILRKRIDHALSPWPPVEPLTALLVPMKLYPPVESVSELGGTLAEPRPGFDPYPNMVKAP